MPCDNRGPLPRQAVRDLLGITRALYRAELAADLPLAEPRFKQLEEAGKEYRMALELAEAGPGTMGSRAAWNWAVKATLTLKACVAHSAELALLVSATAAKLHPQTFQKSRD